MALLFFQKTIFTPLYGLNFGVRDTQSAIGLLEAKNEPSQPRAAPQPGVSCLFKLVMYRQKKHYPEKHEVERGRST
jgi:hypothetical protein